MEDNFNFNSRFEDICIFLATKAAQSAALDLRRSLCMPSVGLREYLHQAERLDRVYRNWTETVSIYKGASDENIFEAFELLFEEKQRIQRKTEKLERAIEKIPLIPKFIVPKIVKRIPIPDRRSRVKGSRVQSALRDNVKLIPFPDKDIKFRFEGGKNVLSYAKDSIEKVHEALLDDICTIVKDERICTKSLQMRFARDFSMNFQQDDKYVKLDAEDTVVEALNKRGPGLVLLHGGPGKGKSALARNLALQVLSRYRAAADPQLSNFHDCSSVGGADKGGAFNFQLAIFLKYGPGSNIPDEYLQLQKCLQLDSLYGKEIAKRLGLSEELDNNSDDMITMAASTSTFDPVIWRVKTEEDALRRLLKEEQVLVILDGMSDTKHHPLILQRMINLCHNHGRDVNLKFLVTSRSTDLCKGLNLTNLTFTSVAMKEINRDSTHAREILASYLELWPGLQLDRHEKFEIINETKGFGEIIENLDANPFALACAAELFSRFFSRLAPSATESQIWEKPLDLPSTATIHGEPHGPGIWTRIGEEFLALREQEKEFLIFIDLCTSKQSSISEEVSMFLWKKLFPSTSRSFLMTVWGTLESKAFIRKDSKFVGSWLVQSLARLFIDYHKRDRQKQMLGRIVDILPDVVVSDEYKLHFRQLQNVSLLLPYRLADDEIVMKITKSSEAVEVFVRALAREINTDLRQHAAHALAVLTQRGSEEVKTTMASSSEIMQGLVKAMTEEAMTDDDSGYLQDHATTTLANLPAEGIPDLDTLVEGKHPDPNIKRRIDERRAVLRSYHHHKGYDPDFSTSHLVEGDDHDLMIKSVVRFGVGLRDFQPDQIYNIRISPT